MSWDAVETGEASHSVKGPAFSKFAKALASGLIGLLFYSAIQVASKNSFAELPWTASIFVLLALSGLVYMYYWILVSRTEINREAIQQTWYANKCVRISEITKVKFICVPYLEWLIAPRIVVQVRGRGSYTFYAAKRELLVEFAKLSMGA